MCVCACACACVCAIESGINILDFLFKINGQTRLAKKVGYIYHSRKQCHDAIERTCTGRRRGSFAVRGGHGDVD